MPFDPDKPINVSKGRFVPDSPAFTPELEALPVPPVPPAQVPPEQGPQMPQRFQRRSGVPAGPTPKSEAFATGGGIALMEPIYGAAGLLPGAVGRFGAAGAKELEERWQKAERQDPVAARLGYWGTMPAVLGLPARALGSLVRGAEVATPGVKIAEGAARGATTGLGLGALQPSAKQDYESRLWDKALMAGVGMATGGLLGGIVPALMPSTYRAASQAQLGAIEELIKSGEFRRAAEQGLYPKLQEQSRAYTTAIKQLQDQGRITEEQARSALASLRAGEGPHLVKLRDEARNAQNEVRSITNTLDQAPSVDRIGAGMLQRIKSYIDGVKGTRRSIADAMYADADAAMNQKFSRGDVWQTSRSGRELLSEINERLAVDETTKITSTERSFLQNTLLRDLRGEKIPAGAMVDEFGRPLQPARTAYMEPSALRETLRKLRDAASGWPEQGYDAIGQQRAGYWAKRLADSLEQWEPSLAQADARYRELSELLRPAQTTRGRISTAGEKFDINEAAVDPIRLADLFFKSSQGVNQLTRLIGGDQNAVEQIASQYVQSQLRGKTPEQARAWLNQSNNWLRQDVLPQTYREANVLVSRYEQAAANSERLSARVRSGAARVGKAAEDIRAIRETQIEDIAKQRAAATEAQQKSLANYQSAQQRIENFISDYERGLTTAKELPNQIRQFLRTPEGRSIPENIQREWIENLNKFDRLTDVEKTSLARAKQVGVSILGLAGLGGVGRMGYPAFERLVERSR
jgi:hypothetical protein